MTQKQADKRHQMAALLRGKIDTILEDWERAVRVSVRGDEGLSKSLLRNSLPMLLENLAAALEDTHWHYHRAKNIEIALEHGRQRHQIEGHEFDQVVDEYADLRKAIIRNVAGEARSTAQGVEVIHEFVDASIKHASGFFAALRHREDKQALVHERDAIRSHAEALEQERQLRTNVIAMLGHDMRTPLSSALLAAESLARDAENSGHNAPKIGRVTRGLERLNAMIQNLLDADRLSAAGPAHPVDRQSCDLSDIFRKAHQELVSVHGQCFTARIADRLEGYWDASALTRLIENLANNAVKYGTADAPISLELKKAGGQAEILVHNEGDAIPAQALPRLFEPHFRTEAAARSTTAGWGLGLALVRAVATAHGGTVSVDSAPDRGTTFCVRMPIDGGFSASNAACAPAR